MAEPSPTVRQRRLVAELRRLRDGSGRTIDEVAANIGLSRSTLSRIENGLVPIKLPVLRALIAEYGVTPSVAAHLEQLRGEAAQRGWWQRAGVSDPIRTTVGLEAEAAWIQYWSGTVIIGLLQTRAYARALLRAIRFTWPDEDVDQAVELRMRRQERLPDLRLSVILGEEVFARMIGGQGVMFEQVQHLIQAAGTSAVDLQIVATGQGEHVGLGGGFEIVGLDEERPEAVYLEGARFEALVDDPAELSLHTLTFDRLRAVALSPSDSLARLEQIAEALAP